MDWGGRADLSAALNFGVSSSEGRTSFCSNALPLPPSSRIGATHPDPRGAQVMEGVRAQKEKLGAPQIYVRGELATAVHRAGQRHPKIHWHSQN